MAVRAHSEQIPTPSAPGGNGGEAALSSSAEAAWAGRPASCFSQTNHESQRERGKEDDRKERTGNSGPHGRVTDHRTADAVRRGADARSTSSETRPCGQRRTHPNPDEEKTNRNKQSEQDASTDRGRKPR